VYDCGINPPQVAGIIEMFEAGDIGSSSATALCSLLCDTDDDARVVAEREQLLQVSDTASLDGWIDEALAAQPQAAEDFAGGKDAAAGRIMGHVMKASGGAADAGLVRARLIERLR